MITMVMVMAATAGVVTLRAMSFFQGQKQILEQLYACNKGMFSGVSGLVRGCVKCVERVC